MNLGILCISSINNTSPGSRVDRIAAKSPLFSILGPLAVFILLPSSLAIINARVVFPNPGGPYKSTWSKLSPLNLAALINTSIFSLTSLCPIYSSNFWGLISNKESSISNF